MINKTTTSAAGKYYRVSGKKIQRLLVLTLLIGVAAGFFIGRFTANNFQPVELPSFTIAAQPNDGMISIGQQAIAQVKAEYGFEKVIDADKLMNSVIPYYPKVGEKLVVRVVQIGQKTAQIFIDPILPGDELNSTANQY